MSINFIRLQNFTVFDDIKIEFSPGINVLIGTNGTGKSHLLKAAYCLCSASSEKDITSKLENEITSKFVRVYLPLDNQLRNLHPQKVKENALLTAEFVSDKKISCSFNSDSDTVKIIENVSYERYSWRPIFIPPKEVLSFMKGFTSLYEQKEIQFDETYADLCTALDSVKFRDNKIPEPSKQAMQKIEDICGGKFIFHGGGNVTFNDGKNEYSANAMAEGYRKIGMLYRLLENGSLHPGASNPLFWDEPEANINPSLVKSLIQILLELSRNRQHIILATHNYVVLKWLDLLMDQENDNVRFHSLFRDEKSKEIVCKSTDQYLNIDPNPIADTFTELYDCEVERSLGGLKV